MATRGGLTVAVGMILASAAAPILGAPFSEGNLVVVQVDGSDPNLFAPWFAYSDNAGEVALVEFTTALPDPVSGDSAPAVQSIVMPTAASGNSHRFTLPPGCNRSGHLTRSANGLLLALGGFDAPVGTFEVVKTNAADVHRVIALVDANGHINTTTGLTDCYHNGTKPTAQFHMVATDDGSRFWIVGKDGNDSDDACTRFARYGDTTSILLDDEKKMKEPRGVNIFNGQLWVSAKENSSRRGIVRFGTGLPETPLMGPDIALQAASQPPGDGSVSPHDFFFLNETTLYVADDRTAADYGGLEKFVYDTNSESPTYNTWVYQYSLSAGIGGPDEQLLRSITGTTDLEGRPVLYAVTAKDEGANALVTVTDTGPDATFTVLQTAPDSMVFRGVEWAPRPCVGDECIGACCTAGGACSETTMESCEGTWQGLGTSCATTVCPLVCPDPFADTDLDGDVDVSDFAVSQRCFGASSTTDAWSDCRCFDRPEPEFLEGNGVIDQNDLSAFLACGAGPAVPADKSCDDPVP